MSNMFLDQIDRGLGKVLSQTSSGSGEDTLEWKLQESATINLKDVANLLFPEILVPDELLTLEFEEFLLKLTPAKGLFELRAARSTTWRLPFGGMLVSAGKTKLVVEREMPDDEDETTSKGSPIEKAEQAQVFEKSDAKDQGTDKDTGNANEKQPITRIAVEVSLEESFSPFEGLTISGGGSLLFKYNPEEEDEAPPTEAKIDNPFEALKPLEKKEKDDVSWVMGGSLSLSLLEQQVQVGVELEETEKKRSLRLAGKVAGMEDSNLISIGDYAWIKSSELEIEISRAKGESPEELKEETKAESISTSSTSTNASKSVEKLTNGVVYTWSISADSRFGIRSPLDQKIQELGGKLTLAREEDGVSFSFLPLPEAAIQFPIPFPIEDDCGKKQFVNGTIYPGATKFEYKTKDGKPQWQFAAQIGFGLSGFDQLSGMHENARKLFADFQRRLPHRSVGTFQISNDGVMIGVDRLLLPEQFDLPPVALPDLVALARGQESVVVLDGQIAAIDAGNFYLSYHKGQGLGMSLDFGYGIPAGIVVSALSMPQEVITRFNEVFNRALQSVFNTYDPQTHEGITRFRLMLTEQAVLFTLVDSPFRFLTLEQNKDDREKSTCTLDFKDLGAVQFDVPQFKFDGTSLAANGRFKIIRPLKIPTKLLKAALANTGAITLGQIDRILPDKLPLVELNLLNPETQQLNVEAVKELFTSFRVSIDATVNEFLELLKTGSAYLPETLKDYLNITIPNELKFEIAIAADGSAKINIETDKDKPLKLLVFNGTGLLGIQLRRFSCGELLSGTLLMMDASVVVDYLPLPNLIASMATTAIVGKTPYFADSKTLRQRFIVDELLLLIVYQTIVPIPIPVFYEEVGIEYYDPYGTKIEAHLGFPQPQLNLLEIVKMAIDLGRFVVDRDALLDDGGVGGLIGMGRSEQSTDIRLRVGKNYIELPPYITDDEGHPLRLGINLSKELEFSAHRSISAALNAIKKQSVNHLIQTLPVNLRIGMRKLRLFNVMSLEAAWMLATPVEFQALTFWHDASDVAKQKLGLMRLDELGVTNEDQTELRQLGWLEPEKIGELIGTLFPDPNQLQQAISLLPPDGGEGMFFYARGKWKLLQAVELDTRIGYAMTRKGMLIQLNSTGRLDVAGMGNLLYSELSAQAYVVQQKQLKFLLEGSYKLNFMGNEMFSGSVSLNNDSFELRGKLDLFPGNSLIDVIGELEGHIRQGSFYLSGRSRVSLFNDTVTLGDTQVVIRSNAQGSEFSLHGEFLGSRVTLNASSSGDNFVLCGTINPFGLNASNGYLSFSGANGQSSPSFTFSTGSQGTQLLIDGAISFLGRTYRGQLIYTPTGWRITGMVFDGILTSYKLSASGSAGDNWFQGFQVNVQIYSLENPDAEQEMASPELASIYLLRAHQDAQKSIELLEPHLFDHYGGKQAAAEALTPIDASRDNSPVFNSRLHERAPGVGLCYDGAHFIVAVAAPNKATWSTYINQGIQSSEVTWFCHGGQINGDPIATGWKKDGRDELWIFGRGLSNEIYRDRYTWRGQSSEWTGWEATGNHTIDAPTLTVRHPYPSSFNIHHRSSDNYVWSRWWDAEGRSDSFCIKGIRGITGSDNTGYPAVYVTRPNQPDVTILISRLQKLYFLNHGDSNKTWLWADNCVSAPAVAVNLADNRFGVAVRLNDGSAGFMYMITADGQRSGVVRLSGIRITGKPGLVVRNGYYHVYARNVEDGCVYGCQAHTNNLEQWSSWDRVTDYPISGSPTVFSFHDNHVGIVMRSAHNAIIYLEWLHIDNVNSWRTVLLGAPWR